MYTAGMRVASYQVIFFEGRSPTLKKVIPLNDVGSTGSTCRYTLSLIAHLELVSPVIKASVAFYNYRYDLSFSSLIRVLVGIVWQSHEQCLQEYTCITAYYTLSLKTVYYCMAQKNAPTVLKRHEGRVYA